VGPGDAGREEAELLAAEMQRLDRQHGDRFLAWHRAGDPLPLDRTVRDYVHHHRNAVGSSTALRYAQFGERLVARLGDRDLRDLREEDIAAFVSAEHGDGRAADPTINACVLLRSVMRASLAARDASRIPHLAEDPLPRITRIARRVARNLWIPSLDDDPRADAWTPDEVHRLFATAHSRSPQVYGVCLFQYSTGCRLGEALGMRWSAIDLESQQVTIRLRVHRGEVGPVKTRNSLRTIPIPVSLADHLATQDTQSDWLFPAPTTRKEPWRDDKYQQAWATVRKAAKVRPLGTHAWRHTFITLALENGRSPGEISEHVGTSVEMIFRRYAHALKRSHRESFDFLAPASPQAAKPPSARASRTSA